MNLFRTATAILALSSASVMASPMVIEFNDFSSVAGLQLNGSAKQAGNSLRLTDALVQGGSAFLTNSIALDNGAAFSSYFSFAMTNPMGIGDADGAGADGIMFVVQTNANNVGGGGGGIGYVGINNSVGIEFDTYNNAGDDQNSGNHVGINLNGSVASVALAHENTPFNNGALWHSWVDYNSVTKKLEVRYNNVAQRPVSASLSYTVDLASVLKSNNAFVGFTSGTGAGGNFHDIKSWTFVNDYQPVNGVSAPATFALFGVAAALVLRRRKSA